MPALRSLAEQEGREIEDRSRSGRMVHGRDLLRRARRTVIERGWHNHVLIGRWLRALDKHMP